MSQKNTQMYRSLEVMAQEKYGLSFRAKSESKFMLLVSALLVLIPGMDADKFMSNVTTHVGGTVYWSEKLHTGESGWKKARTLCHELVHREQELEHGAWYLISYMGWRLLIIPLLVMWIVCLVQAALYAFSDGFAFWHWNLWLCITASVILLPPWPIGTARWEYEAYAVSMWMDYRGRGRNYLEKDAYLDWFVDTFTGPTYYYMQWSRTSTRDKLEVWKQRVLDDTLEEYIPLVKTLNTYVSPYYPNRAKKKPGLSP